MEYDNGNLFARLIRKEIPADIIYEDDYAVAFPDLNPKAPIHILVIPKGEYVSFYDFTEKAPPDLIVGFNKAVFQVIKSMNLQKDGFRILSNQGVNGMQHVPHYHVHIFGGGPLGKMIAE